MRVKHYQKYKEILQRKSHGNYRNLFEGSVNMLANNTESFLWKMNLLKRKKMRNSNMHAIYKIIFQKNKTTKGVSIHIKNTETCPKK